MPDGDPLLPEDPAELGGYRLAGRLGEGGQGVVYLGRDAAGTQVAIKLLHARLAAEPGARDRFIRELSAAKKVARFCTAQVLDADLAGDHPYIVSEYVDGLSLRSHIVADGPRTGGTLERLAIGTLTALAAIHRAGIVHRDFTPHNVLLGPDGPRVIDFGIARALNVACEEETHSVGTPAYMAPEQVTAGRIGPPADMFAWGATILFAATARPPFGNESVPAVMERVLHTDPDVTALPEPLRSVVSSCLAKDPSARPTAQEAQAALLGHDASVPLMPPPAFGSTPDPTPPLTIPQPATNAATAPPVPDDATRADLPRTSGSAPSEPPSDATRTEMPGGAGVVERSDPGGVGERPEVPAFGAAGFGIHGLAVPGAALPPLGEPGPPSPTSTGAAPAENPTVHLALPGFQAVSATQETPLPDALPVPVPPREGGTGGHTQAGEVSGENRSLLSPAVSQAGPVIGGRRPRPWMVLAGVGVVVAGFAIAVPLWPGGGDTVTTPKTRPASASEAPPAPSPSVPVRRQASGAIQASPAKPKPPHGCKEYTRSYTVAKAGTVRFKALVCRGGFTGTAIVADSAPKDAYVPCVQLRGHLKGPGGVFMSTAVMAPKTAQGFKNGPKFRYGSKTKKIEDFVAVNVGRCKGATPAWQSKDQLATG